MGIAQRFPRAVGRVENLILVFQAFHGPVISTVGLVCFGSLLFLRRSAETIRFRAGFQDVCAIGDAIQQRFAEARVRNYLRPLGERQVGGQHDSSFLCSFSHDLKQRGFTFVGSTIMYAHMQAVGMVNDHVVDCYRHRELARLAQRSSARAAR